MLILVPLLLLNVILTFTTKKYTPIMFNPYNESEIKDVAPTMSTCCGSTTSSATSSATILILEDEMSGSAYLRNYGSKGKLQNEICDTLQAAKGWGGGNVPLTAVREYSNFYVLPRAKDGKLINGSYNRVWKDEKIVGAINTTKI